MTRRTQTSRRLDMFPAHERTCIATLWHPHETSKIVTAGWDGYIRLWG